jgi:ATP-dependent Clp protease ATP-binding subunit ClpC
VFERFTEPARQVVVLAQDEARELKHNYIGTEHLLLGLIREERGLAARVLGSLGVTLEGVRAQVGRIIGLGDDVTTGEIPFTPRTKKVLELSLREALALGHNYIGTEHVLLGIVAEGEGVACRILLDFGVSSDAVREGVVRALSGTGARVQLNGPGATAMPAMKRLKRPPRLQLSSALLLGWVLFAVALGVGIAIGWAIWG